MKAESPCPRYGGRPAMALLILVLVAAGGCGGAERPAALEAGTVSPTTGVATTTTHVNTSTAPETTQGTQPAGTPATVSTSVPVTTEPAPPNTTTPESTGATTEATTAAGAAPSTAPDSTSADESGATTTEAPVTVESTTTTTQRPTTTTTRSSTTTKAPTTTRAPTTTKAPTTTTQPAVDGSAVYALNCAVCHNEAGEGGTGADLQQSTLAPAEVTSVIVNGRGKLMPGWDDILTAAEIEAAARYVMTLRE